MDLANRLSDAVLYLVLEPALHVPESMFADMSDTSPFAVHRWSSSALLLVSKSWLRVAKLLLYKVVILRSLAQARSLEASLTMNPALGVFIRSLRVEGGYRAHMRTVLECSPNLRDLYLSRRISEPDNASGIIAGLPSTNPRRLFLTEKGTQKEDPICQQCHFQMRGQLDESCM
ncbi:hypothetical protein C8J57DRAFT_1060515 [Mycena rebaudengoi]|nr:hypothetical protein C8J57DRAFT_1060515 [Mycena rebaudengoi]